MFGSDTHCWLLASRSRTRSAAQPPRAREFQLPTSKTQDATQFDTYYVCAEKSQKVTAVEGIEGAHMIIRSDCESLP